MAQTTASGGPRPRPSLAPATGSHVPPPSLAPRSASSTNHLIRPFAAQLQRQGRGAPPPPGRRKVEAPPRRLVGLVVCEAETLLCREREKKGSPRSHPRTAGRCRSGSPLGRFSALDQRLPPRPQPSASSRPAVAASDRPRSSTRIPFPSAAQDFHSALALPILPTSEVTSLARQRPNFFEVNLINYPNYFDRPATAGVQGSVPGTGWPAPGPAPLRSLFYLAERFRPVRRRPDSFAHPRPVPVLPPPPRPRPAGAPASPHRLVMTYLLLLRSYVFFRIDDAAGRARGLNPDEDVDASGRWQAARLSDGKAEPICWGGDSVPGEDQLTAARGVVAGVSSTPNPPRAGSGPAEPLRFSTRDLWGEAVGTGAVKKTAMCPCPEDAGGTAGGPSPWTWVPGGRAVRPRNRAGAVRRGPPRAGATCCPPGPVARTVGGRWP